MQGAFSFLTHPFIIYHLPFTIYQLQVFTIMKISMQAILVFTTLSGTNANSGGNEFTGVTQQDCELVDSNSVWHDDECVCKEKHLPASFLSGGVILLIQAG